MALSSRTRSRPEAPAKRRSTTASSGLSLRAAASAESTLPAPRASKPRACRACTSRARKTVSSSMTRMLRRASPAVRSPSTSRLRDRQLDDRARAEAGLRAQCDAPTEAICERSGQKHPQPHPGAGHLRGVKRLSHVAQIVGSDPSPTVDDRKARESSRSLDGEEHAGSGLVACVERVLDERTERLRQPAPGHVNRRRCLHLDVEAAVLSVVDPPAELED